MKKVLITGGNGYIGAGLAMKLAMAGYCVTPLCFPEKPDNRQWCDLMDEVLVGNITEPEVIKELSKKDYEIIIHLVSLDHHASSGDPEKVVEVNVIPLWNILHNMGSKGVLRKVIYFSTVQVYGRVPLGTVIDEATIVNPVNAYGLTHYMCEQICALYGRTSDVKCINLRLSNSYAAPVFPDANCWWLVINDLCRQAVTQQKITILSDGTPQRDFVHHDDLFKAVSFLLERDDYSGTVFNLSSGKTYTIMEIADIISDIYQKRFKKELPVLNAEGKSFNLTAKSGELPKTIFDNSRLMNTVGFDPDVVIEDGIEKLFDYLMADTKNKI